MIEQLLARSRPVKPWLLLILVAMIFATTIFINLWFFPSGAYRLLGDLTGGWLSATLQAGWLSILILVVGLIRGAGQLEPAEFGVESHKVLAGVVYAFAIWLVMNLILVVASVPPVQGLSLHPQWSQLGSSSVLSELLGQIVGNALAEEIVYRGFLFVQCLFLLQARLARHRRLWIIVSILAASGIFAISHVPNRFWKEQYISMAAVAGDQVMLLLSGVFFCWIYLRTQNLFFAIGVHALANRPTLLIEPPDYLPAHGLLLLLSIAIAIRWQQLPLTTGERPATTQETQGTGIDPHG